MASLKAALAALAAELVKRALLKPRSAPTTDSDNWAAEVYQRPRPAPPAEVPEVDVEVVTAPRAPGSLPASRSRSAFRARLRSRDELREAVVLREVLGPPLALRRHRRSK